VPDKSAGPQNAAHMPLVIDEDSSAQGWCQYGCPGELPGIKHRREYDKAARHLHTGGSPASSPARSTAVKASRAALEGALDQIAHLGGGLVEAISEVTAGRQAQGRFLFSATVELFGQNGFTRVRQVRQARLDHKQSDPAGLSTGHAVSSPPVP
jgi:hypothetical protein